MRVVGFHTVAVLYLHKPAVTLLQLREHHDAIGRGANRRTGGSADIYALMECAFTGKGVSALAERSVQSAIHWPDAGLKGCDGSEVISSVTVSGLQTMTDFLKKSKSLPALPIKVLPAPVH